MTIYQTALASGLAVQFDIQAGAFVAAVSLRGDDAIYTGRGLTLDEAVIDALGVMDAEANNAS